MAILLEMGYSKQQIFKICHLTDFPQVMIETIDLLEEHDYEIAFQDLYPMVLKIYDRVVEEAPDEE